MNLKRRDRVDRTPNTTMKTKKTNFVCEISIRSSQNPKHIQDKLTVAKYRGTGRDFCSKDVPRPPPPPSIFPASHLASNSSRSVQTWPNMERNGRKKGWQSFRPYALSYRGKERRSGVHLPTSPAERKTAKGYRTMLIVIIWIANKD